MKRESHHERLLVSELNALGCEVLKVRVLANNGFPDRLVIVPLRRSARYYHVELKRTKQHGLERLQDWWRERLERLNAEHHALYDEEDVLAFAEKIRTLLRKEGCL